MNSPLISVIIPAYNNAEFLGDAIKSVLDQTYPNFELIVVNDASPDNTDEVIKGFDDARIKYIVHKENQGLSAARNTGIHNSVGDYVALLDGDDYFHPDKLKAHVEFFEKNPDIGVTYNARFDLNHSAKTIRGLWRPPVSVSLLDLVFGFPFSPSDMVIRREWAFRVNMFDEHYVYVGEDLDFNCRLALAGCKFASVNRALNYRRYHSRRPIKNISYFVDCTIQALESAFADPRCPQEILALKQKAFASHYILWSAIAFGQDDTQQGQEYCLEAIRRNPAFLSGQPNQLLNTLISYSIVDENLDHKPLLRRMVAQLSPELSWLADQLDWAVGRGYLLRFVRAMMWDRTEDGQSYFEKAIAYGANIDKQFLQHLAARILSYQAEFGSEVAHLILESLFPYLEMLGSRADVKWLKGHYSVNEAFHHYFRREYGSVPRVVLSALNNDPSYFYNRGVLKILLSSLVRR
jgi:glycosyltransferase involved in cell wall biosynthesis